MWKICWVFDPQSGLICHFHRKFPQTHFFLSNARMVIVSRRIRNISRCLFKAGTSTPSQDTSKLSRHPFKTLYQDGIPRHSTRAFKTVHFNSLSRHFEAIKQEARSRQSIKTVYQQDTSHRLSRHIKTRSRHFQAIKTPVQDTLSRCHFKTHQHPLKTL